MNIAILLAESILVFALGYFLIKESFPARFGWVIGICGYAVFIVSLFIVPPTFQDYTIFLEAGRDVLAGKDPYQNGMALNTPQSMGFFAFAAWLPPKITHFAHLGFFAIGPIILAWLSHYCIRSYSAEKQSVPKHILGMISALLGLSFGYRYGMNLGQLSVLTAVGLVAALVARRAGLLVLAGIALLVGSLKLPTMLPFLLLFRRKFDVTAWIVLAFVGTTITFAANPPSVFLARCQSCLNLIGKQSLEGGMNNVGFKNSSAVEIISLDRFIYCIGIRDRFWLQVIQIALLALGAAGLFFCIVRGRRPEPALISLLSVYSMLFFYHRIYDTVILVFPFVWQTSVAFAATGYKRWVAMTGLAGILVVWNVRLGGLRALTAQYGHEHGVIGRAIQATMLIYPIWTLFAIIACLLIVGESKVPDSKWGESPSTTL